MLPEPQVQLEPLSVSAERCRDWQQSSSLEWLETNGAGGFAMGTVSGANTRRYHALLVAALRPPAMRMVVLSRLEEEALCDGQSFQLGAAQYPGVVAPSGFEHLDAFRLDPSPVWIYQTGETRIEKKLFLKHGEQTSVILYRASKPCRLLVRPFLACRDYHALQRGGEHFDRSHTHDGKLLQMRPIEQMPPLRMHHNASGFVSMGYWYYQNEYRMEMERGLDFREDLYSPGWFDYQLQPGSVAMLVATLEQMPTPSLDQVLAWEIEEGRRRRTIRSPHPDGGALEELRGRLDLAADHFLVRRSDGSPTIIAGYPWFTDWGRDTMISLPGLLTRRGRLEEARQILAGFLRHLNRGLIPNCFGDRDDPSYNAADATLWMFPAAWDLEEFDGEAFIRDVFYPRAKEILQWHERGTSFGVHVDPQDGLLAAGQPGVQLTWMDAKVGDWVVTPRWGKPVEINALWYNALRMTAEWASRFDNARLAAELASRADAVAQRFEEKFWNPARQCLYDCLAPEGPDDRLRPNQIYALSLPFPLLSPQRRRKVVDIVEDRLLTPCGLRTLEPGHPDYRARYAGGPAERDSAYHQGVVWPYLVGAFVRARLRAYGRTEDNLTFCRALLSHFADELPRGCLGFIGELHDAEAPYRPGGAPAQAWSVAELLCAIDEVSR